MEIKTARLLLREFIPDDWEVVFMYRNDPLYRRFYSGDAEGEAEAQVFVEQMIDQQKSVPRKTYQLAITLPGSLGIIGNAGIRLRGLGGHETGVSQADIGYEVDPRYWGQGYATEAARALLDFGFETLGVHRIWSQCISENRASAHVLEKLGMRPEGRLREHEHFKERYWDTLIYAILEDEWRSNQVK